MTLTNGKIFSYADDTAIVFTGSSWMETKLATENDMAKVASWLRNNLLTLNTTKTNYICYSIYNNFQPDNEFTIKIHSCNEPIHSNCNCPLINKVESAKYLGVMVDQRLSWYSQIEMIVSRMRKFNWIFKTLRHIIPYNVVKNNGTIRNPLNEIYVSLVQSVTTYCISVWGGALKTRFLEIERAQRTLLKIMYFKKRTFSTQSLYKISQLLSIRKLYILGLILKKHKTLKHDPFAKNKRKNRKVHVATLPKVRTEFARVQFEYRSSHVYNKINKELNIHKEPFFECKSIVKKWLQELSYEETESLVKFNG